MEHEPLHEEDEVKEIVFSSCFHMHFYTLHTTQLHE